MEIENKQESPKKYDIRVNPIHNDSSTKAMASVTIGGIFTVDNIRIIEGTNGVFVAMPCYKAKDGKFMEICHPCKEAKEEFNKAILDIYERMTTPKQTGQAHKQEPSMKQEQGE